MLIKEGTKGERVKELQRILNLSKVDGIYGQATRQAVIAFQQKHGLKADGIIGPKTWKVLVGTQEPVKPIYEPVVVAEDFSDPEEQLVVEQIKEECPTSKKLQELAALILNFKYTRTVRRIIYHCTATQPTATVTSIQNYWRNNLGWKSPGYHIIVTADGSWTLLQNFNLASNGVAGRNSDSIHVSYIGGINSAGKALDTRTKEQNETVEACYRLFSEALPNATHHGHNEFSNKACPSFKVNTWISSLEKL
jgi:N-acetylmuramoyl-L-alanine amidase